MCILFRLQHQANMNFRSIHTSQRRKKDLINWRGLEVLRIEAFSDAVFAFAITLLVVSLEVPKTFEELHHNMRGFIPFAISFLMFFQIWAGQNLFFRRYGMHDELTLGLNAVLLFVVLFFVYPMKFLWSALFLSKEFTIHGMEQVQELYYIYSGGFAAIYFIFTLLYIHAYRCREHLQLSQSERFETVTYIYRHAGTVLVGLISVTCAATGTSLGLTMAGMSYILLAPVIGFIHASRAKKHKLLMVHTEHAVAAEGQSHNR